MRSLATNALLLFAALVVGCMRPTPRATVTPPPPPETSGPEPTLADKATCSDGVFVARGEALPFFPLVIGTTVDAPPARAAAVTKGACTVHPAILACRTARKEPHIHGTLVMALEIDAEGKVVAAKRSGGTVDDKELTTCIEAAFASVTFPSTLAGTAQYQVELTRLTRTVRIAETGTDIRGRIPPELIKREIRRNFPRLRGCYEQLLKKVGDVKGTLTFDMVIRLDGTVQSLNVDFTDSFNDTALLNCMAGVMSSLVFPPPDSLVAVRYPLRFETETHE